MSVSAIIALLVALFAVMVFIAIVLLNHLTRPYRRIDWQHRWVNVIDGWVRWYCRRFHRLRGETLNLPPHGGAIVVANHFSGVDGFLLVALSERPLRFLIAEEEYRRFGLQWLFRAIGAIPVARQSRPERAYREAVRQLKAGEVVALFPHGGIRLDSDPPIKLKGGVVRLSTLSQSPVLPLRIEGQRGQGTVVTSFLLRGRVRAEQFDYIFCSEGDNHLQLEQIATVIETPLSAQ